MPFTRVIIHFVWSTKNREPVLEEKLRERIFEHIRNNVRKKGIYIDTIGGYVDHVHALVFLMPKQTMANIALLLKGESSHWVNEQNLTLGYFQWQDEYFAVSVSESMLNKVRNYIHHQAEHHEHSTYTEEEIELRKRYHFQISEKE